MLYKNYVYIQQYFTTPPAPRLLPPLPPPPPPPRPPPRLPPTHCPASPPAALRATLHASPPATHFSATCRPATPPPHRPAARRRAPPLLPAVSSSHCCAWARVPVVEPHTAVRRVTACAWGGAGGGADSRRGAFALCAPRVASPSRCVSAVARGRRRTRCVSVGAWVVAGARRRAWGDA